MDTRDMQAAQANDGSERWELVVTVPPVVETVKTMDVRCGLSHVEVRKTDRGWFASQSGYEVVEPREDHAEAVADARRFVESQERRRLLGNAIDEALTADVEGGEAGA